MSRLGSVAAVLTGLCSAVVYVGRLGVLPEVPALGTALAAAAGVVAARVCATYRLTRRATTAAVLVADGLAVLAVGRLLVVPVAGWLVVAFDAGVAAGLAWAAHRVAGVLLAVVALLVPTAGAGAWSVDEPAPSDPRMVAGNGVVVAVDTHAFLIQQGERILRGDGHTDLAAFLESPDPAAPMRHDGSGREPFLWRVQLGSRDADRALKKTEMPDHFFNWWTHSGKGLVAGPSAATWAEQQFAKAVAAWRAGDRHEAMYRLGAATHLVDDACAPPHELFLVPNHRRYEEWVVGEQGGLAVDHGGIYAADFRVHRGHGGPEWSSAHTRGWVDECSHRAAELVLNTVQASSTSTNPSVQQPLEATEPHFRDTQRLTAGYLAFFFDTVGGP